MYDVIILFGGLSEAGDPGNATQQARNNVKDGVMLSWETSPNADAPKYNPEHVHFYCIPTVNFSFPFLLNFTLIIIALRTF